MTDESDSVPQFAPDLEEEVDRLYGLPLEEFTPARNDLAKASRRATVAAGRKMATALLWPLRIPRATFAAIPIAVMVRCARS